MTRVLLLPAGGRSDRMRGLPKELLPLGIRPARGGVALPIPVLGHAFECGLAASIDRAVVVTSAAKRPLLMATVESLAPPIPVAYVEQPRPLGLGDAVLCAAAEIEKSDATLLLMPDTIVRPAAVVGGLLDELDDSVVAAVTLHHVERPERFGVALFDDGGVFGFVEKPDAPPSSWVWTALAFAPSFLEHVDRARGEGGELGLTEALDLAAREGVLRAVFVDGGVYHDVGTYDDYLEALADTRLTFPETQRSPHDGAYA